MRTWRPEISTAHERATQTDPWVMHLIVAKHYQGSQQQLLADSARAALRLEAEFAGNALYQQAFDAWWAESFRKVALRAKAGQWEQARNLAGVEVGAVRALVPVQRSLRDPLLRKLQALSDQTTIAADDQPEKPGSLTYYLLDTMGLGKQMAQIAHASLKLSVEYQLDPAALAAEASAVVLVEAEQLTALLNSPGQISLIHDAGLTEVDPGTMTVVTVRQPG